MDIYADAYSPWMTQIYFVCCIIICSFFVLNLTVASMLDNYAEMEAKSGGDSKYYESLIEAGEEAKLPFKVIEYLIETDLTSIDTKKKKI